MQETEVKPNGPAAAAILATGIGATVLGLAVVLAEAMPPIKQALNLVPAVGPLSGKTTVMIVGWLVSWIILGLLWQGKSVRFGRVWTATLLLLAIGFVGTFPVVFEAFTAG